MIYNPALWYWYVGGNKTRAWSSAAAAYVLSSEPGFTRWVADGNAPTEITTDSDLWAVLAAQCPAGAPASVPQSVSIMQASLAMHATPGSAAGKTLLDDVEAAVAASSDPRILIAWKRATALERHGLFVTQMALALNLSDDKLDALFTAASGISV